tara:strand:+ start:200 stop:352 length:153 start_codon:yes stop_codon:yes gene_type:complete
LSITEICPLTKFIDAAKSKLPESKGAMLVLPVSRFNYALGIAVRIPNLSF